MRGAKTHGNAARLILAVLLVLALVGGLSSGAWGAGPSGGAGSGPSGGSRPSGSRPTGKPSPAGALGHTGMWIWYVARSNGGNVNSIIATAHRHAVGTVIIKSGDGSSYWSQFSSTLVAELHRGGLNVCAWQFVYGSYPLMEAAVGAQAVRAGANCLLIDAEGQYQGRYAAAQKYLRGLRSLVGTSYPIGLASFPYVDYHPGFPYSIFLGPGGAQFNVPQMYWHAIGVTVDTVYAQTYYYNAVYQRPIVPLGEVDGNPPPKAIERFRQLRRVYHAPATSWWDWQSASPRSWGAISATVADAVDTAPQTGLPTLAYRTAGDIRQGDLVVWAQEHLWSAGYRVTIDGVFGTKTRAAVMRFQAARRIAATGRIDPTTWGALLRYPAANVTWTSTGAQVGAASDGAGGSGRLMMRPPASARLPAVAYEIPASLGAG